MASIRQDIQWRLQKGETLTAEEVVTRYGCTAPVLHHALREMRDAGEQIEKTWTLDDSGRGRFRYRLVPAPEAAPRTLEERVARIEQILEVHRLGQGFLLT